MGKFKRLIRIITLRDRSLMTKLTVYSILLIVVPMTLVGVMSYRESSRILEAETTQYSLQIIDQVKHYVEDYLRSFEISTLKIVNHPDTVRFLKLKTLKEVNDADIVPAVRDVLKNSAYSLSDIINITLILDQIQSIDSINQEGVSTVLGIGQQYWYDSMPVTGLPRSYSRIIEWNGRREPVISIVKRIGNPQTLSPLGMLVIDVNYKRLNEAARNIKFGQAKHGYLFMVDQQGYIVYHPNNSLIGMQVDKEILAEIGDTKRGSVITKTNGQRELISFSHSEPLGWKIMTVIPYDELMKGREYIGRIILLVSLISVFLVFLLSVGLAANLIQPIKRLYRHMKRVEIGDLKVKVPVDSKDEVAMLSIGFNKMVDRLSDLLHEAYMSRLKEAEMHLRQKDTELKMLQAQINPHFLYNSLETIRGMALEHDIDDIAEMAADLTRLLRYNVKHSQAIVTVGEEMEIIEFYLRIQKLRFEERLTYQLDVPEWALPQRIPKLSLQPLVENSLMHGMEHCRGNTIVRISAERLSGNYMALMVTDNGPGIEPARLETLRSDMDDPDQEPASIGLTNVHRRIRFVFGDPCGLQLESEAGSGTTVRAILPLKLSGGEASANQYHVG